MEENVRNGAGILAWRFDFAIKNVVNAQEVCKARFVLQVHMKMRFGMQPNQLENSKLSFVQSNGRQPLATKYDWRTFRKRTYRVRVYWKACVSSIEGRDGIQTAAATKIAKTPFWLGRLWELLAPNQCSTISRIDLMMNQFTGVWLQLS